MSEVNQFPVEDYLVERITPEELPDTLICMDDRPTIQFGLYAQHAGGVDGVARDIVTGQEVHKPGSLAKLSLPMHYYSAIIASDLNLLGVDAWMHDDCKAYTVSETVAQTTVNRAQEVLQRAQEIDPHMTFERFDRIHAANQRILRSQVILPVEKSDPDLLYGIDDEINVPGIVRVPLVNEPHMAGDIIVDKNTDALWDVRKAFDAGNPAYYISHGIFEKIVTELRRRKISNISASTSAIMDASVVRHAALSLLLPVPEGQDRLRIHRREAV